MADVVVTREDRRAAYLLYYGSEPLDGSPHASWVETGDRRFRLLNELALAYATGRQRERADVVAECERTERLSSTEGHPSQDRIRAKSDQFSESHVGKATGGLRFDRLAPQ